MLETTIALIIFLFPLAYSPGPGNMFFAANGARFGLRATLPANFGYHLATWIVTAAIGFGLFTLMQQHPQIFALLKNAGAGYVLWIAWKLFRAGVTDGAPPSKPASFFDGAVLLVLNPKAYVIIALMFSQFLGHRDQPQPGAVLLITTVFTLNNFIAFIVWIKLGDTVASRFRSPNEARVLNMGFGVILGAVAVWMLVSY